MQALLRKLLKYGFSAVLWLASAAGATRDDWLRWILKVMPWFENPWVWVAGITISSAWMAWNVAVWATERRLASKASDFPDGHETDAAAILCHVANNSKWSEREVRRLNFRQMVDACVEFRRAALDDGLRTTGRPLTGGLPVPIVRNHWIGMDIAPNTSTTPYGVVARSRRRHATMDGFAELSAHTADIERVWPSSTLADRLVTRACVRAKKTYYLLTPDAWLNRYHRCRHASIRATKISRVIWRRRNRAISRQDAPSAPQSPPNTSRKTRQ